MVIELDVAFNYSPNSFVAKEFELILEFLLNYVTYIGFYSISGCPTGFWKEGSHIAILSLSLLAPTLSS